MNLIDLVPTVLGLMGWPMHPGFRGIDLLSADRRLWKTVFCSCIRKTHSHALIQCCLRDVASSFTTEGPVKRDSLMCPPIQVNNTIRFRPTQPSAANFVTYYLIGDAGNWLFIICSTTSITTRQALSVSAISCQTMELSHRIQLLQTDDGMRSRNSGVPVATLPSW